MNPENNLRLIVTKAILWFLVGVSAAVAVARYLRGLGATTALTDANPWGLWIGFDVLSGVALAAGGFVIAATVYIFHMDKYHAVVRPAVLTAFLGYLAVALGLMVDLGRPWNIWRPMFFWQLESPLFEVAWCVMLYLAVLALEFVPVVFEGLKWERPLRLMRRLTLALVIAGIGLSTLHQSSLGTLFLLAKDRLHPLWYSPMLPLLFFVSAIGLGLVMVTTESCVTSWLYRRDAEWPLLRGLTRAASVVMALYLVLRIGDLAWRGQLQHLLDASWVSVLFVVELAMTTLIPILLFTLPATRSKGWAVTAGAITAVIGFILHRADVGGIAHIPATGESYLPALTEISISFGLVSAMALIFLFFVEHFPVWEEQPENKHHFTPPMADPVSRVYFGGYWFGRSHLASLSCVVGVVLGVVMLEVTTAEGAAPQARPIQPVRSTAAVRAPSPGVERPPLRLVAEPAALEQLPEGFTTALLIDGDGSGKSVIFDHKDHQHRLGADLSCAKCHHRNLRMERGTPCSRCHRDLYRDSDTFSHELHVQKLHQNHSCVRCHPDAGLAKTRSNATQCRECHAADYSTVFEVHPTQARPRGMAPGYRLAMHGLCIKCHIVHEAQSGVEEPRLSRCANCHTAQAQERPAVSAPAEKQPILAFLGTP